MSSLGSVTLRKKIILKTQHNPLIISSFNQIITFYLGTEDLRRLIHHHDYIMTIIN